ncbi:Protocatechuate 3,4-dioxygenase beta subunit [Nonomuraea solani]|uniref:Protocatechuate 3,4-dioxygenase beta subunit n=1 Tax=Nonomuraea solani TaxID=1144553 RepID=A0A1H5UKB1_9ACTN|nr:intradiol ring-cleavage dioxygenase [Nonomuraea solani]SEF74697.1 Protocatechuate 3,4-dioxygenase beta subunit [Nonomuraea solani]
MEHDHEGQRVSRRRLITGIGSLGLGGVALAPESVFARAGTCALTPSATQGPFYFDAGKIRSDIREDRPGVRLRLAIKVQDGTSCRPLRDAVVEIWHCDATGLYSGAEKESKNDAGAPPGTGGSVPDMKDMKPTDGKRYLRGAQVTNAVGTVEFTTIWPGWYPGRTVHIHVMVHVAGERVLSTQLMFDEKLNDRVFARPPYTRREGRRDTFNNGDGLFHDGLLLRVTEEGDGYLGAIVLSAPSS